MTKIVKINEMIQDPTPKVVFKPIGIPKHSFNAAVLGFSFANGASIGSSYQTDGTEPLSFSKETSVEGFPTYELVNNIHYLNFNFLRYSSAVNIKANTKYTFVANFKAGAATGQRLFSIGTTPGQIIGLIVANGGGSLNLLHGADTVTLAGYKANELNKVAVHITNTGSFAVVNGIVTNLAATIPAWGATKAYLMGSSNLASYTSNYSVSLFEIYEDVTHTEQQLVDYTA